VRKFYIKELYKNLRVNPRLEVGHNRGETKPSLIRKYRGLYKGGGCEIGRGGHPERVGSQGGAGGLSGKRVHPHVLPVLIPL